MSPVDYSGFGHEPVPSLEQELSFLEVDVAVLEYFEHAAFDDRIDAVLEGAQLQTCVYSARGVCDEPLLAGEFDHNGYENKKLITKYKMSAVESNTDPYTFTLAPVSPNPTELSATAESDGTFSFYNEKNDSCFVLSGYETAQIAFRAMGLSDEAALKILERSDNDPNAVAFQTIIEQIWRILAESQGSVANNYLTTTTMYDDVRHREAEVRFELTKKELEDASEIHFTLEKAFIYPELEAEEAYRLQIIYYQKTVEDKKAEKAIRGDGGLSVKFFQTIHVDPGGKKTELDTTDPEIMQDFIEAYEALLQSAA